MAGWCRVVLWQRRLLANQVPTTHRASPRSPPSGATTNSRIAQRFALFFAGTTFFVGALVLAAAAFFVGALVLAAAGLFGVAV